MRRWTVVGGTLLAAAVLAGCTHSSNAGGSMADMHGDSAASAGSAAGGAAAPAAPAGDRAAAKAARRTGRSGR